MDCIFCKIAGGDIPAKKIHEDEHAIAFLDIDPKAPVHFLIIPKAHMASLAHTEPGDEALLGHLLALAPRLARDQRLENGFRTVINTGLDGGQTVGHLHVHVFGGRAMSWPPG